MSTTMFHDGPDNHDDRPVRTGRFRAIALRPKVALTSDALTRELAAGAPPGFSPELMLLASKLVSVRHRRQLARAWRRAIAEARRPALTRSTVTIIRRRAVIDAEGAISVLIERLTDHAPVAVEGMAKLERLMTDDSWSPLYVPAEPGSLRRQLVVTTEALEPALADLPLAA